MNDIVQPLHKEGAVCRKCGSDGGQHFGDCEDHPTNVYMRNKDNLEEIQRATLQPGSGHVAFAKAPIIQSQWLSGTEMKVTEGFMKQAVEQITGSKVASVRFKGKSFVVVFE